MLRNQRERQKASVELMLHEAILYSMRGGSNMNLLRFFQSPKIINLKDRERFELFIRPFGDSGEDFG